ncbi:MAG: hypothetical protein WC223_13060 [Bacteroidales bacterium]|jgi:hypothetical protein
MRKSFLFGLVFLSCSYLFGQYKSDSIETIKKLGTVFKQKGKVLKPKDLLDIMELNYMATKEMKIAKNNYDVASVFGFAGGFLIGWPVGTMLGGGEPMWALAAIGGGLVAISIPFSISYSKHAKSAVKIYNSGLRQTGSKDMKFQFSFTGDTFGVLIIF